MNLTLCNECMELLEEDSVFKAEVYRAIFMHCYESGEPVKTPDLHSPLRTAIIDLERKNFLLTTEATRDLVYVVPRELAICESCRKK